MGMKIGATVCLFLASAATDLSPTACGYRYWMYLQVSCRLMHPVPNECLEHGESGSVHGRRTNQKGQGTVDGQSQIHSSSVRRFLLHWSHDTSSFIL